jgi:hypothetical protein
MVIHDTVAEGRYHHDPLVLQYVELLLLLLILFDARILEVTVPIETWQFRMCPLL